MQTKPLTPNKPDTEMAAAGAFANAMAKEVADGCNYRSGTDNYARVYQAAHIAARRSYARLRTPTAPTDVGELVERLCKEERSHGHAAFPATCWLRNPDGPEAAAALTSQSTQLSAMAGDNARLREALGLALMWLEPHEPPDSRAVSNEFVAMAAIHAGLTDNVGECMEIIRAEIARLALEIPAAPGEGDGA